MAGIINSAQQQPPKLDADGKPMQYDESGNLVGTGAAIKSDPINAPYGYKMGTTDANGNYSGPIALTKEEYGGSAASQTGSATTSSGAQPLAMGTQQIAKESPQNIYTGQPSLTQTPPAISSTGAPASGIINAAITSSAGSSGSQQMSQDWLNAFKQGSQTSGATQWGGGSLSALDASGNRIYTDASGKRITVNANTDLHQLASQNPGIMAQWNAQYNYAPAAGYNPTQLSDPKQWSVTPDQTVEGRIQSILGSNSPIIQQARTRALEQMNGRGLLSSSMAIGAGETAAYDAALPIASADAATAAKAAGYNADERNQFSVANQNASNTGGQFNAGAQNSLAAQKLAADTQLGTANISANTQLASANISANTQRYMSDQSAATQMAVSKMSTQSQQVISQQHDANSVLLQNSQAAQQAYQQYVQNVGTIDIQNTMDAAAKAAAIKTQTDIFNNAISGLRGASPSAPDVSSPLNVGGSSPSVTQAVSAVGGVDVSHMLDFGGP